MKKRAAGIFQLIKHIYETAINDFHAIFQSNSRHYLTTLPNFDRSKILTVYETICEGGPRKFAANPTVRLSVMFKSAKLVSR
jgi:hypothetical protein